MRARNGAASGPSTACTNMQRLVLGGTDCEVASAPETGEHTIGALHGNWSDTSHQNGSRTLLHDEWKVVLAGGCKLDTGMI